MRRLLPAVLACLFLQASLSAGETAELRFSWWGGGARHESTLAAIKIFEERNPGVVIKAEYMGWGGYVERLTTQIGSASEPDIMQINWAWIDMLSHDGNGFLDLNTMKQHLKLDEYSDDAIASGVSAGRLNALPFGLTTHEWLWNKTMWDRAGATLPKTWDDLLAAGPKFKAMGDQYYAMDLEPPDGMYISLAWLHEKYGEQIVHPTEPRIGASREHLIEVLTYVKELQDSHTAISAGVRTSVAGQFDRVAEQVGEFINGTWAGTFAFDANLYLRSSVTERDFGMDMVLGPMLTFDGKNLKPDRIGRPNMMFAVSKNSDHPEIAARFVSFLLTDPDAALALGTTRGLPLAKTSYKTLLDAGMINAIDIESQAQLAGTKFVYINPLQEHERFLSMLKIEYEELSHGSKSPEEVADYLLTDGQRILDRLARRD